jgi:alpha-galactosidase
LIAGNDVWTMSAQTRAILTNPDVIAVDQDPLAAQGRPVPADSRITVKPLADGGAAVALFNPDSQPVSIETSVSALGLRSAPCHTVRDVWSNTQTTTTGIIGGAPIPAHGVVLLRITPGCP